MIGTNPKIADQCCLRAGMFLRGSGFLLPLFFCLWGFDPASSLAADSSPTVNAIGPLDAASVPHFNVLEYEIEGIKLPSTNNLTPMYSKYVGTNVSLVEIVQAASDLQSEYRSRGYPLVSVAIAEKRITNGIVTMYVFQGAFQQILVSGKRYIASSNGVEVASNPSPAELNHHPESTNTAPPAIQFEKKATPDTPEELARTRESLLQKMAELAAQEKDTRVHVVSTNGGPRFEVEKYYVEGNSVLSPEIVASVMTNVDGAFGTNVSKEGVIAAAMELQKAYRERGFVTVAVGVPQQKITNATVKVEVTEGRLANIKVAGNHYFSSNDVMRTLPSLHTNTILNGQIFTAELNRANANQDRQIYPALSPGLEPGTSDLTLTIKDRLPLHAKTELNNQSSPGTPDLRVNSSAVYNNLWQQENSLGVQYSFSPELYKSYSPVAYDAYNFSFPKVAQLYKNANDWNFYDQPLVATYSAFYRMPLGKPESIEDIVASNPGSFGYDEATRKFTLPPPSGQPELTVYASRATIDTSLTTLFKETLFATNGASVNRQDVQQDLTVNNSIGSRLSIPLRPIGDLQSTISGGLDFKSYNLTSYKINIYTIQGTIVNLPGDSPPTYINVSTNYSPVPVTTSDLKYLPLALRYDASWHDSFGAATLGLGLSANLWYSGLYSTTTGNTNGDIKTTNLSGLKALQQIAGSKESSGHWVILNPSFSQNFEIYTNWTMTLRADGQWASEPLISNEQFGAGGINSVRGYKEGEAFGRHRLARFIGAADRRPWWWALFMAILRSPSAAQSTWTTPELI